MDEEAVTKSEDDRARHLKVVREGTVKRFVITHVGKYDLRCLTFAKQGRNTYETRAEAQALLDLYKKPGGLERVLTPAQMATLEVREVDCYPGHFDPVSYYMD